MKPTSWSARFIPVAVALIGIVFAVGSPSRVGGETGHPNPLGWEWARSPVPYEPFSVAGGHGLILERQVEDGELVIRLVHPVGERLKFRPVAISGEGERHDFDEGQGVRLDEFAYAIFRLPEARLPEEEIALLGLEVLTAEGKREIAEASRAEARRLGMELLLPPEPGQEMDFALTTFEGQTASDETLAGRVILVDVWATWCQPCMAKMPLLERLYEELHTEGFEIVGVNMDRDVETFQRFRDELGMSWPQVFVPAEPEKRRLWERATGIEVLPRQFLIDRRGLLRDDMISVSAPELEKRIRGLVSE